MLRRADGRIWLCALFLLCWAGCQKNPGSPAATARQDTLSAEIGTPVSSHSQIAAWDIAIPPNGQGLPQGGGTAAQGEALFEFNSSDGSVDPRQSDGTSGADGGPCASGPSKCAGCHGDQGRGGVSSPALAPQLVGGRPLDPDNPVRTVGSYWPYATTLFDYIRRAMPFDCPGALTDDEVYAVTAYLLYLSQIIEKDERIDQDSLPGINARMPNHGNFIQTPPPFLPQGPKPEGR